MAAALADDLRGNRVDLVLVSGDLTQRARRAQFRAARDWLDGLGVPWLTVPGNHDVPLYDLARRALDPYGRYRRLVHPELEPTFQDDELSVLGLNTVQPRTWKSGLVRQHALARLASWSEASAGKFRVVVAHHPFTRHGATEGELVTGWKEAVTALENARVDLLLTGHVHRFRHSESRDYAVDGPHRLVVVGASTSISNRRRGEPNQYSVVEVDDEEIRVLTRVHEGGRFEAGPRHAYPRARGIQAGAPVKVIPGTSPRTIGP